jgi:hypothetical protein
MAIVLVGRSVEVQTEREHEALPLRRRVQAAAGGGSRASSSASM